MKSNDKTVLISGMMFNVTFFLSMMMSVFITNAVAIAIVASTVTFLFFDRCYYTKKTDTHANE
ncbi:hypothetical protein AB6F24_13010 [Staphylococcus haemolyticus]|uniref:hypothetical protein n=1 Tax=Staphylococcus haemolyticus TaxID=1283 RepID=UPI0034DD93A6